MWSNANLCTMRTLQHQTTFDPWSNWFTVFLLTLFYSPAYTDPKQHYIHPHLTLCWSFLEQLWYSWDPPGRGPTHRMDSISLNLSRLRQSITTGANTKSYSPEHQSIQRKQNGLGLGWGWRAKNIQERKFKAKCVECECVCMCVCLSLCYTHFNPAVA